MSDDGELLHGGVANAGAVYRVGDEVLRPAPANHATLHRFLRHVTKSGLLTVSEPIALTGDGRERMRFIRGDVPIPPYPTWAQSDATLASVAKLIRALHEASRDFVREPDDAWGQQGPSADPTGPVICHYDVCLENVVFRSGVAVGLLDFEFAAPGRPINDLASFARMCIPIDDDASRERLGWSVTNLPDRLRLIADSYDITPQERSEFVPAIDRVIAIHGQLVQQRAEAGDPGFVAMWQAMGGAPRLQRRLDWWARHREQFVAVMRS